MYHRKDIEELRKKPCRRGHSRHDAYIQWEYRFGEHYRWLRCRTCMMESPSYARLKQKLREGSRDDLGIAQATTDVATFQTDARGHQLSAGAFGPPGVS